MMKRTRVEEVQYGTRPGPGGVGGSGGGGGANGTGVSVGTAGVSIGTVVPGAHGATIGVGITGGINTGPVVHHRILTPQHGGAQTIAYMPSTTPSVTNLKGTSTTIVDNNGGSGSGVTTAGPVSSLSQISTAVVSTVGSGGIPTQAVQYSTSYNVTSVQPVGSAGGLKNPSAVDGTVQIHVTTGSGAVPSVPTTLQSSTIRQRTISGTQNSGSNLSTPQQQQIVTQTTPTSSQPTNGPVINTGSSTTQPRLKVEDALSYLDQVKYKYAEQPQIYNNFLDIMKEFKSHCIDTPGVIERVSTLFKGHTELIYGFNMFLPPGYKIEIHSDELGCSVPVVSMPSPPAAPPSTVAVHSNLVSSNTLANSQHQIKSTSTVGSASIMPTAHSTVGLSQMQTGGAVNLMTHGGASLTQTTIHALQQQQQAPSQSPSHAHVTVASAASPASVGSAGQVQNVSVGAVGATHMPQNYSRDRDRATITQTSGTTNANIVVAGPPTPNSLSELSPHGSGSQHNLHHIQQAHQSILLGETTGQQNQPVEFNHAITYVNKIKNRFQNQPAKYKKFLEILHAYQKEQKVMKEGSLNQGKVLTEQEVYTQVAKLFGQDEDLLREFGQFLPDATNHQATVQYMSKTHNDHKRTTGTLSGGAHISMSPASSGSPLQLSSGATLSQIDNTAHATAIGNLSAVNTTVSIKGYSNNMQSNHVVSATGIPTVPGRNDIIFEKDYTNMSTMAHHPAGLGGQHIMPANTATTIRGSSNSGGFYEKESHRNNHHAVNQKFSSHSQNTNIANSGHHLSGGNNLKKSPSYGGSSGVPSTGLSTIPHITGSGSNLERGTAVGTNYTVQSLSGNSHHHISGVRRQIDDSGGGIGSGGGTGGNLNSAPPAKRHKPICRDVSFSEASRKCTISDAAFFDKVRKGLRNPEVYDNFLRCLTLFNQEIVSKSELLLLVSPFLTKFPDLLRWFTDFLGSPVSQTNSGAGPHVESMPLQTTQRQSSSSSSHDRQSNHQSGDFAQEIDLASCKRLGASYCALPQSTIPKKCSGRTALCREVLNDKWVSFPTWASEDSTFVTSRKTQFEETIYRTEDERFELDLVIEVNSATIRVLEGVVKKMSRMSPEELARFHLDDYLGGTSQTIQQRAIHRIYGDKAGEIIQGLKRNPSIAVPIVLKRLKVKEEEWREAQKGFNKQWREQNEKYYLKSLDHQAIYFKPNDMKALRSKSLFNEIETLYDERHEQEDENGEPVTGPHLIMHYKDKTILDDAANLLIHHVKRQTGIQKQEKTKIKHILRQFVPDLFFTIRQPLSDDERDEDDNDKMEIDSTTSQTETTKNIKTGTTTTTTATTPAVTGTGSSNTTSPTRITTTAATTTPTSTISKTENADVTLISTSLVANVTKTIDSTKGTASNSPNKNCDTTELDVTMSNANLANVIDDMKVEVKLEDEPIRPNHALSSHPEEAYTLFFANNNWYLFFRLHAILCERLYNIYERAHILTLEEHKYRATRRESTATALRLKPRPDVEVEDYYPTFLDMLKNVLDGNMDSNSFEDGMREMFGIHAYTSFTLDKVVSNAVRQLQNCVTERAALDCVELFASEQRRGATGNLCRDAHKNYERELSYQRKAENSLSDENCFKVYIYKIDCRVTIELLAEAEEVEKSTHNKTKNWNKYIEHLANPVASSTNSASPATCKTTAVNSAANENIVDVAEVKTECPEEYELLKRIPRKPRFLKRNKRTSRLMEEQKRQLSEHTHKNATHASASTTVTSVKPNEIDNSVMDKNPKTANAGDVDKVNSAVLTNQWNSRVPERMGTQSIGCLADNYLFNDRDEITMNAIAGRCLVTSKNLKFFKIDAVRRAKLSHLHVTQKKYTRFQKFQIKWLAENVSSTQQQQCNDWLLGKLIEQQLKNNANWTMPKTKALLQNDMKKTPYRLFNRYKVFSNGSVVNTTSTNTTATAAITLATTPTSTPTSTTSSSASDSGLSSNSSNNTIPDATATHCNNTTTGGAAVSATTATVTAATATNNSAETATLQVRPMES